jgi:hypothetical protein
VTKSYTDSEKSLAVDVPFEPLKPRRGLFRLFCVIFALWMIAMVVMYFETVAPHKRRTSHSTEATAPLPH